MNTQQTEYTEAEIKQGAILLARMQPYLLQGMTLREAGEAVLIRDAEIVAEVRNNADVRRAIVEEIAPIVYKQIRA